MSSPATETAGAADPFRLPPSTTRRFFLPIILLKSLLKVFKKEKAIRFLDDPKDDPADTYEKFVNKLGHICDSAKGGAKVTAFAILQLGVIQYYFTSNNRDEEDYERTSDYITRILKTLGEASNHDVARRLPKASEPPVFSTLLGMILRFNQSRIKGYMFALKESLEFCIQSAKDDPSNDAKMTYMSLGYLDNQLNQFCHKTASLDQFLEGSQGVILALTSLYQDEIKDYLLLRTKNNTDPDAPWVKVSHSIARLLSYYYAVDILFSARRRWPQLFDDFEVHWIPSAADQVPNIPRAKLNANVILGKMFNAPLKAEFTEYAAALENSHISLNTEITRIARNYTTTVHAEVNLHAHVLRLLRAQGGQDVPVFFDGNRYIGCSKPTCRLCELWFRNHPSDVRVRPGHRNLYHEWRPGDVDGQAEFDVREATLTRMIPLIKDLVAADLRGRCATRYLNDSNDVPTNLPLTATGTDVFSTRAVDDLVSMVGQMGVEDVEERGEAAVSTNGSPSGPQVAREVVFEATSDVDDDDDGGGAKL